MSMGNSFCTEKKGLKINPHMWGIKEYYDFISKEELQLEATAMLGERYLRMENL